MSKKERPLARSGAHATFGDDLARLHCTSDALNFLLDNLAAAEKEPRLPPVTPTATLPRSRQRKRSKEWERRSVVLENIVADAIEEISEQAGQCDTGMVDLWLAATHPHRHLLTFAQQGNEVAARLLVRLAVELCEDLEQLALAKPSVLIKTAKHNHAWPALIGKHPDIQKANKRLLKLLDVGKACGLKLEKPARAKRIWTDNTPANRLALRLMDLMDGIRRQAFILSPVRQRSPQTQLVRQIVRLKDFRDSEWQEWAEAAWKVLLALTNGKPESVPALRKLSKRANREAAHARAGIRERLFEAFGKIAAFRQS